MFLVIRKCILDGIRWVKCYYKISLLVYFSREHCFLSNWPLVTVNPWLISAIYATAKIGKMNTIYKNKWLGLLSTQPQPPLIPSQFNALADEKWRLRWLLNRVERINHITLRHRKNNTQHENVARRTRSKAKSRSRNQLRKWIFHYEWFTSGSSAAETFPHRWLCLYPAHDVSIYIYMDHSCFPCDGRREPTICSGTRYYICSQHHCESTLTGRRAALSWMIVLLPFVWWVRKVVLCVEQIVWLLDGKQGRDDWMQLAERGLPPL